ncbi:MAG: hypothetical protein KDC15_05620 [Chitinophagaceae bacterium]|nr:hypothetical protein [Chitinophagaceae bacterium]
MKKFRTTEVSNPKYNAEGLSFITVKSKNLNGRGDIVISKPAGSKQDIPVIIFLHGVYGSAWSWPLCSGVHMQVKKMQQKKVLPPFLLVFPSDGLWGDGSGYVPHDGYDFEKWIAEDVPEIIMQNVNGVTKKSKFFITGLSMGGFGAMKIGAKYNRLFTAFSGHSSITNLQQMKLFTEEGLQHYLQENEIDNDVFKTILANKNKIRPFRFDCGMSDLLYNDNLQLGQQLIAADIPHIFEDFKGGHEWAYWEKHIMRSIRFFAGYL